MRFFMFKDREGKGIAVQRSDGSFIGLREGEVGYPGSLDDLVRADALGSAAEALQSGTAIDPNKVQFVQPFSRANKILCVGLNYADHSGEMEMKKPDYPLVFGRFNSSTIAHGQPLVRSRLSESFDYEGEMVAIIGKGGRDIKVENALNHVAGYSIFNDATVREYQEKSPQWMISKNFDGSGAFGPYFVTADELPPGASGLRIETRLNGKIMQKANTADMLFDVASLISILSESLTLEAGDLIVTGTPAGVGAARKPPVFLKPGDLCEIEIQGIGILTNPVVDEADLVEWSPVL